MRTETLSGKNLIRPAAIMQDHNHQSNLQVHWEFAEDPNDNELLRRVAKLILEDRPALSPATPIDSESTRTLNECVLVEEHKQTND